MSKEVIALSIKELERLRIIHKVMSKEIRQMDGAVLLGLTDRQVRNIIGKIKADGDKGIAHGNRGREAANKTPKELEEKIGSIIEEKYADFGPTLASEQLLKHEGIKISHEKVRQIMIRQGLWKVRKRRDGPVYKWRERREYTGEMVQLDGSHHEWLEERGPKMVFMGYIDDATNRTYGRFYDHEGVYPAMDSMERYILRYGLPQSLYLDKHSTYKTIRQPYVEEELRGRQAETQFKRAVGELKIEMIHADSPQGKGRVERLFGTLQDRLIKEMRLAKISSIEEANVFLESYLEDYNKRFSRAPKREGDLHRPLPEDVNLRDIFCIKGIRTINDGYIIQWKKRLFILDAPSLVLRRRKVEVQEQFTGKITFKYKGRSLDCHEVFEVKPKKQEEVKLAVHRPRKKSKYRPSPDHPWHKPFRDLPDKC
ncbi:MAG: ISNCY family transposase [Candidatus Aminicenantes bacterium]|jgi:transposase